MATPEETGPEEAVPEEAVSEKTTPDEERQAGAGQGERNPFADVASKVDTLVGISLIGLAVVGVFAVLAALAAVWYHSNYIAAALCYIVAALSFGLLLRTLVEPKRGPPFHS